jgi:DNA repair photolyase
MQDLTLWICIDFFRGRGENSHRYMAATVPKKQRGRGTSSTIDPRYLAHRRECIDDGWNGEPDPERIPTQVTVERPKTIISRNQSPDIPFDQSINPYRGCEHGCIYCYARPTHAYMDLSPGIDFESRLFVKSNAAALLRRELEKPGYVCTPIALGANTDPYQPLEREHRITRSIIEVLAEYRHPMTIVTKSRLVERDIDLLAPMASQDLCKVFVSVTTLDADLARVMEPRASPPARRLETLARLSAAGIPTGVLFAPVIPGLNDMHLESVVEAAAAAGAETAGYIMLRLPLEINQLFKEWLETHEPLKAKHVMQLIRDLRGGRENDPNFFSRHSGTGVFAGLIKQRFEHACRKQGLNRSERQLDTGRFRGRQASQLQLF